MAAWAASLAIGAMYAVVLERLFRSRRNKYFEAPGQKSADILPTVIASNPALMTARKPRDGQAFCLKGELFGDASPLMKADEQRRGT
jgi:hypothetical protein